MSRKRFTRKDRERIFNAAKGICHICGGEIDPAAGWEVEHVTPWALTRDDSDENLRPAHVKCHRRKTHQVDRPRISKAERMRAKHRGLWPKPIGNARLPSRPFPPSRNQHPLKERN